MLEVRQVRFDLTLSSKESCEVIKNCIAATLCDKAAETLLTVDSNDKTSEAMWVKAKQEILEWLSYYFFLALRLGWLRGPRVSFDSAIG